MSAGCLDEFFIVAARRSAGGLPKLSKALGSLMFYTYEEAKGVADEKNLEYVTDVYTVFRCSGTVEEQL